MANEIPSSMATNSAQPIVRPSRFQPFLSFQACHSLLKITPMPQSVEASTQNGMGDGSGGALMTEPAKEADKVPCHQRISSWTGLGGVFRMWGDVAPLKDATKRHSAGRRDRPSGMARQQWTKVPRRFCDSRSVNLSPWVHGRSFSWYFCFFSSGISTVLLAMSHKNPRYLKRLLKGQVLEGFHGQPSSRAMA